MSLRLTAILIALQAGTSASDQIRVTPLDERCVGLMLEIHDEQRDPRARQIAWRAVNIFIGRLDAMRLPVDMDVIRNAEVPTGPARAALFDECARVLESTLSVEEGMRRMREAR